MSEDDEDDFFDIEGDDDIPSLERRRSSVQNRLSRQNSSAITNQKKDEIQKQKQLQNDLDNYRNQENQESQEVNIDLANKEQNDMKYELIQIQKKMLQVDKKQKKALKEQEKQLQEKIREKRRQSKQEKQKQKEEQRLKKLQEQEQRLLEERKIEEENKLLQIKLQKQKEEEELKKIQQQKLQEENQRKLKERIQQEKLEREKKEQERQIERERKQKEFEKQRLIIEEELRQKKLQQQEIERQQEAERKQQELERKKKEISEKAALKNILSQQQSSQMAKNYYEHKEGYVLNEREHLRTANLRKFHNWIKSSLIKTYSDIQKKQLKQYFDLSKDAQKLFVLEIGCGQGGDIQKWDKAQIAVLVGVDISVSSLNEAKRRIDGLIKRKFGAVLFEEYGNAQTEQFFYYFNDQMKFDMVSSQFVIHYMFDSEQSARNLFTNMSSRLVKDGRILLTFPDSNVIVKKLRQAGKNDQGKYRISNKYYAIETDTIDFPKKQKYGLAYDFFLEEAVGSKADGKITYVKEYLIELNNFIQLAKEYDLEVVENLNFLDYYKKYRETYKDLLGILKFNLNENDVIDHELWEISHLYRAVVLRKTKGSNVQLKLRETYYQGVFNNRKPVIIYEKSASQIQKEKLKQAQTQAFTHQ